MNFKFKSLNFVDKSLNFKNMQVGETLSLKLMFEFQRSFLEFQNFNLWIFKNKVWNLKKKF